MTVNYIGSEEFKQMLNQWMVDYQPRAADRLNANRNLIPDTLRSYTRTLYLATTVDDQFINKANSSNGYMDDYTFWTKDLTHARSISKGQKLLPGEYKILIEKNVPTRDQIIDLDKFISFVGVPQLSMFGFDESSLRRLESYKGVLVSKQIRVSRTEYTIIEQRPVQQPTTSQQSQGR